MPIIGKFQRKQRKQIPAHIGFQATAGDNTLHLTPKTAGHDCVIHWGDGTKTTVPVDGGNVIHNYAEAGLYDIKIRGTSFAGFRVKSQAGKEKYVALYSMGEWENETMDCQYAFRGTNISFVHEDAFKYCVKIPNFAETFRQCILLQTIPENLFASNVDVISFYSCFSSSGLTSIPENLFRYNVNTTTFNYVFYECKNITSIPALLFRYNINGTDFASVFAGTNITSIPAELFRYNINMKLISSVFMNCKMLTSIPAELFRYNIKIDGFITVFSGCSMLTSVPADLFRYNINAVFFNATFQNCTKLKNLPADLFAYNIQVVSYQDCFNNCVALTLRDDIFGKDYENRFKRSMDFRNCFFRRSFAGIQGTAPALWQFNFSYTPQKATCFAGGGNDAYSLSNYYSIPSDWK